MGVDVAGEGKAEASYGLAVTALRPCHPLPCRCMTSLPRPSCLQSRASAVKHA